MTTSVNTNVGAQIALQSLTNTQNLLAKTEKRISTGYRVADASDDGGAFAVAEKVRSDVSALTAVNTDLGNAQGLVSVTQTALTSLSASLTTAKGLLVQIGDASISTSQRTQYISNFNNLVQAVANTVDGSTYNGQTLLGAASGAVAGSSKSVIANEYGSQSTIHGADNSTLAVSLAALIGESFSRTAGGVDTFSVVTAATAQTTAQAALQVGAGFDTAQSALLNQLNQSGADANLITSTVTRNSAKIDSLNTGIGAIVDADLAKESANLQSLQIKQQLGTQSLSIANQAPQALLSLFK